MHDAVASMTSPCEDVANHRGYVASLRSEPSESSTRASIYIKFAKASLAKEGDAVMNAALDALRRFVVELRTKSCSMGAGLPSFADERASLEQVLTAAFADEWDEETANKTTHAMLTLGFAKSAPIFCKPLKSGAGAHLKKIAAGRLAAWSADKGAPLRSAR